MQCRVEPAKRAQPGFRPVSQAIKTGLITAADHQRRTLCRQRTAHLIDQSPALVGGIGLVAAESACLSAGQDRSDYSHASWLAG